MFPSNLFKEICHNKYISRISFLHFFSYIFLLYKQYQCPLQKQKEVSFQPLSFYFIWTKTFPLKYFEFCEFREILNQIFFTVDNGCHLYEFLPQPFFFYFYLFPLRYKYDFEFWKYGIHVKKHVICFILERLELEIFT